MFQNQTNSQIKQNKLIFREEILGSRRFSNYCWAVILSLGSISFFLAGISSFVGSNLLPFVNTKELLFFPQGLVMCFYGIVGFFLSLYLWLVIVWNVGQGSNEFNKESGFVKVFRWGFPGKNRRIQMVYPLKDIEAIRIDLKEGVNPKRALYLKIRGKNDIPLTQIGQPLTLGEIEKKSADLATFLQVSIE